MSCNTTDDDAVQNMATELMNGSPRSPRIQLPSVLDHETFDITLHRKDIEGFGFVILTSKSKPPAGVIPHKIGRIIEGSPTDRCGLLSVGDRISAVNGQSIIELSHNDIVQLIKDAGSTVTLTVVPEDEYKGPPSGASSAKQSPALQHRTLKSRTQEERYNLDTEDIRDELAWEEYRTLPLSEKGALSVTGSKQGCILVELERGSRGFGFSLRGGTEYNMGLYILRLAEDGPALQDGRIQVGDQIVEINGEPTQGISHTRAIELIQAGGNKVLLLLRPGPGHVTDNSPAADSKVSSPPTSPGVSFPSDPQPSDALAFPFCESHLHPSSPSSRKKDDKDGKDRKSPSALSPNFSESKDSLSPHHKPRSKDRRAKAQDSASPSALQSRKVKRSRSAEYTADFGSTERKLNNLSKTKEEPHKSRRSTEIRQQHKQDSSRHRKSSKQQPSHTKSVRKSNQERQEGVTNEIQETKQVVQRNDRKDCSEGRDHSRGRQQNKDRQNDRKKAGKNGQGQGAGLNGHVEPQNMLGTKKQPQERHDRDTSKSRKTKRHGHCAPREEDKVQHSKSKELQHDLRRITETEDSDKQIYDPKVIQTDDETESEDGFTIIYDPHEPESPNKNSSLNRNGLWKVPNFARILTHEEVMSDIYG